MKNLVSSYIQLACIVYSGEVRGEVGTRSHVLCRMGGVGTGVLVLYAILG